MQRYTVDKKEGNREFDVTMGSNDGAKMCKIVYSTGEKFNKDGFTGYIGLYRDACFKNNNGHQSYKIRKELIKIF